VPSGYVTDGSGPRRTDKQGRTFMTWPEVADLVARGHVVGCHTQSHKRLPDGSAGELIETEVVAAKANLEAGLGAPVDSFCWVGGEEWSYGAEAARLIAASGYRWSFMTNCAVITPQTDPQRLDRTNVEAAWPIAQVRFYLSGIMDIAYAGKRRRLARRLGGAG
jgi:peptidoglycan/xylan/chitin deacetylase (PgdA/CDA1 family)